jgi:uncharacterized protein (DUF1697 family)
MTDLKILYEEIGLQKVRTYIQSGNVIFSTDAKIAELRIIKNIEEAITKKYNFTVAVVIRSIDEMEKVISSNPFLKEENINTEKLYVTFLTDCPNKPNSEILSKVDYFPDRFILNGKEIYLYCPNGYGKTKLSNIFFENKLKTIATTRNWKTVNKLFDLAKEKLIC